MGYPTDGMFQNPRLKRILRGIKRFHGDPSSRELRLPITKEVLTKALARLTEYQVNFEQANLYAAFCVAFSGFLHIGEFTYAANDMTYDFANWHFTT
jgi:hypothetical protein